MNENLSNSAVDAADAASLKRYEQLLYPDLFFWGTHPDNIALVAALFGMSPASPARCRVLELGSGSGGNLISMAEYLRGSEFVGIERSQRHVEIGKLRIAELGLSNVQFVQQDLRQVTPQLGTFDYILCHGVYSWVPAEVRRKILDICRENLAPQGVAYISYNTYPGWKMREVLRDAIVDGASATDDPLQRVAEARKRMREIQAGLSNRTDPYAVYLRGEITQLEMTPDAYIAHEHLEGLTTPCYFREFVERARQAKLMFISEVNVARALSEDLPPLVRASLNELRGSIEREQYRDFILNTGFRKSLLCHDAVRLETKFTSERFRSFYFTTPLFPETLLDPTSQEESLFVHGQAKMKTTSPLVKAAVGTLAQSAPQRLSFDALLSETVHRLGGAEQVDVQQTAKSLENTLLEMFVDGLVQLYTRPIDYADKGGECPIARPIARLAARKGELIPNFLNQTVTLEAHDQRLMQLMDGTRDQKTLSELYRPILAELSVQAVRPGDPLQHELAKFARASLLLA